MLFSFGGKKVIGKVGWRHSCLKEKAWAIKLLVQVISLVGVNKVPLHDEHQEALDGDIDLDKKIVD